MSLYIHSKRTFNTIYDVHRQYIKPNFMVECDYIGVNQNSILMVNNSIYTCLPFEQVDFHF